MYPVTISLHDRMPRTWGQIKTNKHGLFLFKDPQLQLRTTILVSTTLFQNPSFITSITITMTRFTSSASKAKKDIFWLLLDPVNTFAAPHIFPLTDYEWQHTRAEEFMRYRLSSEIQSWFGFHPELSTMRLWIVSLPAPDPLSVLCAKPPSHQPRNRIPIQDVKPEWFAKNFDLTSIATHYPLLHSTMNCFLGEGKPLEEPQQDVIHLIVTAKRQEQQDEKEHEKSDTRSRLGLHTYRSEVSSMSYYCALC